MKFLLPAVALFLLSALLRAADPNLALALEPGQFQVVPSFEAASFYFRPERTVTGPFMVEFRCAGDAAWRRAFEPVTDRPEGIWKGSLFDLTEDTAWQARVLAGDGSPAARPTEFRTWTSRPPIGRTIDLSTLAPSPDGIVIADRGTPDAWVKYTAPRGWHFAPTPGQNPDIPAAITVRNARYVILENLTIVGGARHGILVEDSDAVRVLNCDISGWGRVGVQQFTNSSARGKYADARGELINYDGGVVIHRSVGTVVERCYVHDPRGRANSWMLSHPAGPTAVFVHNTRGGNVVRWNDFIGSDEHRWNDVIEGSSNSSAEGGFFRDSDVAGNFLAFGNDDGVELEGGGMNVRFYRNKIEGTTCSVSTGACILGPQFIIGNLVTNPGDEAGLALWFLKNGHGVEQGGRRHFVGNTLVGPRVGAYGPYGKVVGPGRIGYLRNNIFVCSTTRLPGEANRRDDFDGDLFWTGDAAGAQATLAAWRQLGQQQHALSADPKFVGAPQGDFHLALDSPARRAAVVVPNLTPGGSALGAFADEANEVPFRPLDLVAAPRQLNFTVAGQSGRQQVTLRVPATARAAVPFEIRQNRVSSWFRVEPASGVVAPGGRVTLTVATDAAALRGRPLFRGAFLVRTPSGLSRPVSVYAAGEFREDVRPGAAPHTAYVLVAELPGWRDRAVATDAPGVVGGRIVTLTSRHEPSAVETAFSVPAAGAYSLLGRMSLHGEIGGRLGFELSVDGAAPTPVAVTTDYQWNTGGKNVRAVYLHALGNLTSGEHRLRLTVAQGAVNLNELIVTDRPAAFFIDEWQRAKE